MLNSYYPITQSGKADWWQNILTEGPAVFSAIGLDAPLQGNILRDASYAVLALRTVPAAFDQFAKTLTGWSNTYMNGPNGSPGPGIPPIPSFPAMPPVSCPAGIEERRAAWVQTIKNHPNYNPLTHGATLKIEQTGTPFVPGDYTAEIKSLLSQGGGKVEIKLDKARGQIDSNCVYGRKTGSANFALMGKFNAATATLTIPGLAPGALEEWEFYTRGVIKDEEIGNPSGHQTVIVKG